MLTRLEHGPETTPIGLVADSSESELWAVSMFDDAGNGIVRDGSHANASVNNSTTNLTLSLAKCIGSFSLIFPQ